MKKKAVILVNLGTPDSATKAGVSNFLKEFLSDRRVVEVPKFIWWFVLRCAVIPLRAKKVVNAYKKIWWEEGSPLRVISTRQVRSLQQKLDEAYGREAPLVANAATYGSPSLKAVVAELESKGVERFMVIPMYPQYSGSTTGAIYDQLTKIIYGARNVPDITVVKSFYDYSLYISALAACVKKHWEQQKGEKLLMSFHGIPQEYADKGDPYEIHCRSTAELLAAELGLKSNEWAMGFQSRFGPKKWLKPYVDTQLTQWAKEGVKSVDIISPAFTADCLETLEELDIGYRELFLSAGGEKYHYIPCVNDSPVFIDALFGLVKSRFS